MPQVLKAILWDTYVMVRVNILAHIGTSNASCQNSFYLYHSYSHKLAIFTANTASIQVKNFQHCVILFVISVTIIVHQLHLEIFILVSEIHDHVGLVPGIKNLFEIVADLNTKKI